MSYNLLKGKRGIIFGALNDQSIAWKVAERAVEEGATITLSNTPQQFAEYKTVGLEKGFNIVESAPLVRSSYHAEKHIR